MDAEVRSGFAAMKRIVDTATKRSDTMAAAGRDDDGTTTERNDTLAVAGCHEERTETKTEGETEFLFVMGNETNETQKQELKQMQQEARRCNNKQGNSSRQTQLWQEWMTLRNARRKTD